MLSVAMITSSIDGISLMSKQQVQASEVDDNQCVNLNEEFASSKTVCFELEECGKVEFLDEDGNKAKIFGLYNETEKKYITVPQGGYVSWEYYGEVESCFFDRVRLAKGKYSVSSLGGIAKIVFISENNEQYEQENNDYLDNANLIKCNNEYIGNLNCYSGKFYYRDYEYHKYYNNYYNDCNQEDAKYYLSQDIDYYKIVLSQGGKIKVELNRYNCVLYAEDEDGNVEQVFGEANTTHRIPSGTYYLKIQGPNYLNNHYGNGSYIEDEDYKFKINFTPETADACEQEYNNEMTSANLIKTNQSYSGSIEDKDDVDYFKFTLDEKAKVKIKSTIKRQSEDGLYNIGLYRSNGTGKIAEFTTNTNPVSYTTEKELVAGDYYVIVKAGSTTNSEQDYKFEVMTAPINVETQQPTKEPVETEEEQETPKPTKEPVEPKEEKETPKPTKEPTVTKEPVKTKEPVETKQPDETQDTITTDEADMVNQLRVYCDMDQDDIIRVGDVFNVYAEVEPEELNDELEVEWKSSNSKIATVSESGKVTCKSVGTVTISAITTDGSDITDSIRITIKRALSSVNTLSNMTYTQGMLTPSFSKSKKAYTLVLGKNMSKTVLRFYKTDSKSTIKVNGKSTAQCVVKLKAGASKEIKVVVKAESGKSRTYKIKVKRKK